MQVPVFTRKIRVERALEIVGGRLDPLSFECVSYTRRRAFLEACEDAMVAVVFSGDDARAIRDDIAAFREETHVGLVWIQGPVSNRLGARDPRLVTLEGIDSIPTRDVEAFPVAFHHARTYGFLRGEARRMDASPTPSRRLKRYVSAGLLADPPCLGTGALARACRVRPAAVQRAFAAEAQATPKPFTQSILAVHIAMRRPFGMSWEWLARTLDTDARRLRRTTRIVLDRTPEEAATAHGRAAMRWFRGFMTRAFRLDADRSLTSGTDG